MEYFSAEWNGHKIVVENKMKETLFIDGKPVAASKPGVRMGIALDAEIEGENGLHCFVLLDMTADLLHASGSCIIGKLAETEYNKETKAHTAVVDGKKIEVINKSQSVLLVDGEEVDREPNGLHFSNIHSTKPDADGKRLFAILDGVSEFRLKPKCSVYSDAVAVEMYKAQKDENGNIVPLERLNKLVD